MSFSYDPCALLTADLYIEVGDLADNVRRFRISCAKYYESVRDVLGGFPDISDSTAQCEYDDTGIHHASARSQSPWKTTADLLTAKYFITLNAHESVHA